MEQTTEMPTPALPDLPVIELVQPMPGFPDRRRFALVMLDDAGTLCALRSLEDPDLRFLVVTPGSFFPGYSPEIDDAAAAELGLTVAEDALVLLVLTAGATLDETTANLLAPVVVNIATRRAAQIILDDSSLPVSAPLVA
ncbi:flagellar assembly protein FliW [Nocardioides dongkuii]|uniref:flagellar assembly protein FliW n=1 Tax=Nocardioides dongkuii TaxID=2760089 RepID=UPI001D0CBEC2|nr:flagellar assembly protein FliW [Nocardioides dongkuii]